MANQAHGDLCVHGIQLRRFPVPVQARGKATIVVERTGRAATTERRLEPAVAVEAVARTLMSDGRALGFSVPGHHQFEGADARAAMLFIPLTAHTGEYPRSINRVPVRLVRVRQAQAL